MEYINFGKYKGMKFSETPTDYLEWLINSHSSNEIRNKARDEILRRKKNNKENKKLICGIIEKEKKCFRCKKLTKVITLTFYKSYKNIHSYGKKE